MTTAKEKVKEKKVPLKKMDLIESITISKKVNLFTEMMDYKTIQKLVSSLEGLVDDKSQIEITDGWIFVLIDIKTSEKPLFDLYDEIVKTLIPEGDSLKAHLKNFRRSSYIGLLVDAKKDVKRGGRNCGYIVVTDYNKRHMKNRFRFITPFRAKDERRRYRTSKNTRPFSSSFIGVYRSAIILEYDVTDYIEKGPNKFRPLIKAHTTEIQLQLDKDEDGFNIIRKIDIKNKKEIRKCDTVENVFYTLFNNRFWSQHVDEELFNDVEFCVEKVAAFKTEDELYEEEEVSQENVDVAEVEGDVDDSHNERDQETTEADETSTESEEHIDDDEVSDTDDFDENSGVDDTTESEDSDEKEEEQSS